VGKIFPNFLTARKLTKEEKKIYGAPFEDEERRYIMLCPIKKKSQPHK
jgi:hypothetical protein